MAHLLLNSLLNKFMNLYPSEHIRSVYFCQQASITNTLLESLIKKPSSLKLYCIIHTSSMILVSEYPTKYIHCNCSDLFLGVVRCCPLQVQALSHAPPMGDLQGAPTFKSKHRSTQVWVKGISYLPLVLPIRLLYPSLNLGSSYEGGSSTRREVESCFLKIFILESFEQSFSSL